MWRVQYTIFYFVTKCQYNAQNDKSKVVTLANQKIVGMLAAVLDTFVSLKRIG